MRSQVFIVGEREHGTRKLVEAMLAFSTGAPIQSSRRSIPTRRPEVEAERPRMIINDFGPPRGSRDESIAEAVQGPKRPFLLIHCGDGFRRVMAERRCRAEAVVWVLSAVHEHDETEVNDVLRATYLGARPVLVFIMDAEHKELAHECERFARKTLTKYELKGDERTVLFSTGRMEPGTADTAWRDAIAQLFDELERQTPLPEDVRRPMTVVIGSRIVSEQARVGGIVRGEPVTLGMEVDLPVLGRRARIVSLAQADGARLDRIDVGRWAEMTLEGVSGSEITREIVVTTPGAAKLVRSCTGRVCELNDEVVPQSVHVRGHSTATNAAIEWLDARFMIPRRAKLVFNGPTAWADDNYVVLHDPRAVIEKPDTLLWLATFDADEIEYA